MKIKKIKEKHYTAYRWTLKIILNTWTIVAITIFSVDFLSQNKINSSASAIGIIYLGILGIYASEKEYSRWKKKFESDHIGELFVIAWTVVMIFFVFVATFSKGIYTLPGEFAIVYTSVIGVFAITARSKALRSNK